MLLTPYLSEEMKVTMKLNRNCDATGGIDAHILATFKLSVLDNMCNLHE